MAVGTFVEESIDVQVNRILIRDWGPFRDCQSPNTSSLCAGLSCVEKILALLQSEDRDAWELSPEGQVYRKIVSDTAEFLRSGSYPESQEHLRWVEEKSSIVQRNFLTIVRVVRRV